ncbi:unnamed protein product [Ectocarpus sp. 12 AP-2014]
MKLFRLLLIEWHLYAADKMVLADLIVISSAVEAMLSQSVVASAGASFHIAACFPCPCPTLVSRHVQITKSFIVYSPACQFSLTGGQVSRGYMYQHQPVLAFVSSPCMHYPS